MRVRLILAWYDLWIGVFIDTAKRRVYILPLPCCGIVVEFERQQTLTPTASKD